MVARRAGAIWGLIGVTLILSDAIARVLPYTQDALRGGLTAPQWIVLVLWVALMIVAEGYRGFQKRFSPRVTGRGLGLLRDGHGVDLWLAPLYCIGYFHAPRRELITSWCLTAGIVGLILIVRTFAQPWRGIVDAGVLAGLAYGLLSVFGCLIAQLRRPSTVAAAA